MEYQTYLSYLNSRWLLAEATESVNSINWQTVIMFVGLLSAVLGIIGGFIGLIKVYNDVLRLINDFRKNDAITKSKIETLDDRINRADNDIIELKHFIEDKYANIETQITLLFTKITYRDNWQDYVDKGEISQEQLNRIRENSKDNID